MTLSVAERERDKALARIRGNNTRWLVDALKIVSNLHGSWVGTGEDIHQVVHECLGLPSHHNAWGMLIRMAIKRQLIKPTGRYLKMKTKKSHARMTPEYRR